LFQRVGEEVKGQDMRKHLSIVAALAAALSVAVIMPAADAHQGRGFGGHGGFHGGHRGFGYGGQWYGSGWYGGGWYDAYGRDWDSPWYGYDYDYCYWRHGKRFCRY
jgi:hypothetical protein